MTISTHWVWSDLHIDHENVLKWRPQFRNMDHMVDVLETAHASRVKKHDTTLFLGDISFSKRGWERIGTWPGHKILILGNHDTERRGLRVGEIDGMDIFNAIHSMMNYKGFLLTHAPIHPYSLRGRINIHGHQHNARVPDPRYYNVCVDLNGFAPISLDDVAARTFNEVPNPCEEPTL